MINIKYSNKLKTYILGMSIGLTVSIFIGILTYSIIHMKYQTIFEEEVKEVIKLIELKLKLYENTLKGLKNTYDINDRPMNFFEFQRYNSKTLELLDTTIGVGFYRYFNIKNASEFQGIIQNEDTGGLLEYSQFKLDPNQISQHNLFVQYAFPFKDFKRALGKNILLLNNRKEILAYALKNDIAMTPKIKILSEIPKDAIIYFMPVFKKSNEVTKNLDTQNLKNKTFENLYGFVSIGFDINKLFKFVLEEHATHHRIIEINVMDISDNQNSTELYNTLDNKIHYDFQYISHLEHNGRKWQLDFRSKDNFINIYFTLLPYIAFLTTLLISGLLTRQFYSKRELAHRNQLLLDAYEVLDQNEKQLHEIIDTIPMVFLIINISNQVILLSNKITLNVFEIQNNFHTMDEFYVEPNQHERLLTELEKNNFELKGIEILLQKQHGGKFWGLASIKKSEFQDHSVLLMTIHDITHRKKNEETLRILATTDSMTGLYNRRHFMSLANELLIRSIQHKFPLSFLMIDIDFFKKINDTYGHDVGDQAIVQLAFNAMKFFPEDAIIGRLGGEEFGIILPNQTLDSAIDLATAFKHHTYSQEIRVEKQQTVLSYTISVGVSTLRCSSCAYMKECIHLGEYGKSYQSIELLLKLADIALYKAKQNGRNQVQYSI